jgi:hypothetical protein
VADLRTLDDRVVHLAQWFVRVLEKSGIRVTVTSTRRSMGEQQRLYDRWKAGLSKYPAAKPGSSTHGLGLAFDLALDPPVYRAAGELWERLGFTWGGRFSDPIHFDFRPHRRT